MMFTAVVLWVLWLATAADTTNVFDSPFSFDGSCNDLYAYAVPTCHQLQALTAFSYLTWLFRESISLSCYLFSLTHVFTSLLLGSHGVLCHRTRHVHHQSQRRPEDMDLVCQGRRFLRCWCWRWTSCCSRSFPRRCSCTCDAATSVPAYHRTYTYYSGSHYGLTAV